MSCTLSHEPAPVVTGNSPDGIKKAANHALPFNVNTVFFERALHVHKSERLQKVVTPTAVLIVYWKAIAAGFGAFSRVPPLDHVPQREDDHPYHWTKQSKMDTI